MILIIDGHSFHYEMENLCRLFFHHEKIEVRKELPPLQETPGALAVLTALRQESGTTAITVELWEPGGEKQRYCETLKGPQATDSGAQELCMGRLLFKALSQLRGFRPQWGIITGVRPVKLLRALCEKSGEDQAAADFQQIYLASPEKVQLSLATMKNEQKILERSKPNAFSLYISIPFCPTRCSYCSFVSSSVEKTMKLIPAYVELLCQEIAAAGACAGRLGLHLETVYFGGGTPTTLEAGQLNTLLKAVHTHFDLSGCREFTVEAGRPDTITPEKLKALSQNQVTRISINPQTLDDRILKIIGRRHTAQQTLDAFALARRLGFQNINMDLIAGLPGDSAAGFGHTLDQVLALNPESITVHTLALKRSSHIYQEENGESAGAAETARMLAYVQQRLPARGYEPYYLYRQSRMVGNLENVGWARPGAESPYNVFIMDESQTILGCGAGAVTKVKDPHSENLERIFNFKHPYEYIDRFNEIIARKEQVDQLYEKFNRAIRTLR